MRIFFGRNITNLAIKDKKIVVLTGDLGHGVFEKLQEAVGFRFINAGVAEHNMATVAAGLAYSGMKPWIYSVAPFVTIKILEEIRNDISLPNFNVKIVGLGAGYDYAIAGPTHHILQDVSMMLSLQNFKVYAPGFAEDLEPIMKKMSLEKNPSYLRISKAEKSDIKIPHFSPLRNLVKGSKVTVIVLGSIINKVLPALEGIEKKNLIDLWLVSEMPFSIRKELLNSIRKTKNLIIIEEHVKIGALGSFISELLIEKGITVNKFIHLFAKGYISHKCGSRDFYLKESGLDVESIKKAVKKLI